MSEPTTLSAGKLQFRLALLFLLMAACLIGLSGAYWLTVLEPRLLAEGRSSAAALAQSQSLNLAEALLAAVSTDSPQKLADAMDEALILIDPASPSFMAWKSKSTTIPSSMHGVSACAAAISIAVTALPARYCSIHD